MQGLICMSHRELTRLEILQRIEERRLTESQIYQSICRAVSFETRLAWETALFEKRKDGVTHLDWLQSAPKRKSQKTLRNLFQKIEYLTTLGVADIELRDVPMERLQIYARQLQHKRPARFRRLTSAWAKIPPPARG
jgi:hypothetical protein